MTVQGGGGGGSGGSGWTGSAAGLGGQGGLGGNASLTVDVDATYANITVQGGAGGRGGNVGTSMTAGVAGGAGGSAALNAAGQAVTVAGTLTVASGANGETGNNSGTTQGGAGGAGGAASFTADTLIAPTINLTKNGGAVNFNVTNLEIGSGFNTTLNATGLGAGDTANIAVLLLTGDKNFTVNGTGVTVGQLNINNGTLNDANWSNLVGGGITYSAQNIALTGTVTVDISDNQSTDRNLTGAGAALTKSGSGTLTLSGANTYTGDTTVAGGTLAVTGTLGGGAYAGDISNAGALVFDQTASQLLSGIISGTGGITKDGSGTLDLIGDNTYTGTTRVSGGALTIGTAGGDWNISDHLILENGTTLNAGGLIGMTSGNLAMLDVYGSANWSGGDLNMGAGNAMNFYVPTDMAAGGTMLTVDGAADITNSAVAVGINGGSSDLKAGDTITLIDATGGLTANQGGSRAQGLQGIAKIFEFDLTTDADKLFATVASAQNNEQLKALSEGRAAGLAFVSQGADMIMGQGMGSLLSATRTDSIASFGAAIGGGSSRYKTGSHIDVDGVSMLVGLGLRTPRESGSIVAGAFFEAGWGNYSSRNSFNNAPSVKGKGDTSYYGGGVLGRYEAPTGMYAEASLRAGRVKNDFRSSDILNSDSDTTKYDSGSAYYGAHAGLGYVWNMNEKASLDMSTRYIWTHQASDSVTISGDRIKFKDADSQ
ncbi:MAG: autotransporter-associated beta strand repeat-containing protein, partial [Betaproteobacteria bacterium]|nr:autotransporter-associated beta strand repeat-containing protein [Betaproteobacteria bacterium]